MDFDVPTLHCVFLHDDDTMDSFSLKYPFEAAKAPLKRIHSAVILERARLRKEDLDFTCYNIGSFGYTANQVLERFSEYSAAELSLLPSPFSDVEFGISTTEQQVHILCVANSHLGTFNRDLFCHWFVLIWLLL